MHFVLCFWHILQTRGIMPMMVLKYHVQKLMHVAICMNITIMWMKEWVELYTFCKIRVSTLIVKNISLGLQNPLQIFPSGAILYHSSPDNPIEPSKHIINFIFNDYVLSFLFAFLLLQRNFHNLHKCKQYK